MVEKHSYLQVMHISHCEQHCQRNCKVIFQEANFILRDVIYLNLVPHLLQPTLRLQMASSCFFADSFFKYHVACKEKKDVNANSLSSSYH